MSMIDNLIFLSRHGFKLSYGVIITSYQNYNNNFPLKFNYKNTIYIIQQYWPIIFIKYVKLIEMEDVVNYVTTFLNITDFNYKFVNVHAIGTLNMKISNLNFVDIVSIYKYNVELDMTCETFINKKHGGLCFNGTFSDIIENYKILYSIIKLPIILDVLFDQANSYFYILPLELKNVILSFIK